MQDFFELIRGRNIELIKKYIESYKGDTNVLVNSKGDLDCTPALCASMKGELDILKLLHKYGADLNESDMFGFTPAFLAGVNENIPILEFLHQNNVNINKADINGITPLRICINEKKVLSILFIYEHSSGLSQIEKSMCHSYKMIQMCNNGMEKARSIDATGEHIDYSDSPHM